MNNNLDRVCQYCGSPLGAEMPFVCKYCGGSFCSEHRLPEAHECPGLRQVKDKVSRGEMPMFTRKRVAKEIKVNFDTGQTWFRPSNLWDRIKRFLRKIFH